MKYIITEYIEKAMKKAIYDKLEDGTFAGRIPDCIGVVSFGKTLAECEEELRSALEDWILLGLQMGHKLPVIDKINLNRIDTKVEAH